MATPKLKLKRIAPGCYQTLDGQYLVVGFQRPEKDHYGPAGEWRWYWRRVDDDAHDHYDTKREAVEALAAYFENKSAQALDTPAQEC